MVLMSLSCGGGKEDRAYPRGPAVIAAVPNVDFLKPDVSEADFLVFLPLATRDENGELKGLLAESWEHSPDYREWIYHLRTDVLWHDGAPVTAHDLKFTIDLLAHPDVLEYPHLSATVLNDSTLKIESSNVHAYQYDLVYYPKHLLEHLDPKGFFDWEFWRQPVGNGPYRFVRYMPQTMIEFEANPNYYRGKPAIERVVLKFVGATGGLAELLSGNVNVWPYANPAHIPQLAADPRFRVYQKIFPGGLAIYWQHNNPLFHDPRVRRAFTLAINRRELLKLLNFPENFPLIDGPITVRQFHRRQLPEPITYDPDQACALLDAAGWHDPDGDGVRDREGQAFRFTAIVHSDPYVNSDKSAVYIQAQLRQVGVQMDIQMLDGSVIWERLNIGKFDAAFMIVQSAPQWYQKYFGADSPLGYNNPEVIKLIDQAVATADPNEEDRIYRELMRIFQEEQPITYTIPLTLTYFVHRRIHGLSTPFRADPLEIMGDLWIEEEK
jgi:peptide/nickel transport system substrate-binding protein